MKSYSITLLIPVVLLFGCSGEVVEHSLQEVNCVHGITFDNGKINFQINSQLSQVEVCISNVQHDNTLTKTWCRNIRKSFFDCSSMTAEGIVYVEVYAENYCSQILDCR